LQRVREEAERCVSWVIVLRSWRFKRSIQFECSWQAQDSRGQYNLNVLDKLTFEDLACQRTYQSYLSLIAKSIFTKKNANVSNKYLWTSMGLLMRDHQIAQTCNLVESTKSCREEKGVLYINCAGQLMSARRRLPLQPPFVQVVIRKERQFPVLILSLFFFSRILLGLHSAPTTTPVSSFCQRFWKQLGKDS
jgi:hypothetical protein